MISKFGAQNFYCFKEGVEISFELNKKCPSSISHGQKISKALCVKGANGSGKTNALRILTVLKGFCCNSFSLKPDETNYFYSFYNSSEPTNFFIDFFVENIEYRYELSATRTNVKYEKLYRKKSRLVPVFIREKNKLEYCLREYKELEVVKLRSNASIVSTANQYEVVGMKKIYSFFESIITNVTFLTIDHDSPNESAFAKYYKDNKFAMDFVKEIICDSDLGISDIVIRNRKDESGKDKYYPVFLHLVDGNKKYLTMYDESTGTKVLFFQLARYIFTLVIGGILVMDEFDTNLHPHILPKLLKLFTDPNKNKKNAQIIFTTHNTEIMNLMGKYRTVLVNKENNESYAYRLDEIPGDIIRNDRLISSLYNDGKIGGIPKI